MERIQPTNSSFLSTLHSRVSKGLCQGIPRAYLNSFQRFPMHPNNSHYDSCQDEANSVMHHFESSHPLFPVPVFFILYFCCLLNCTLQNKCQHVCFEFYILKSSPKRAFIIVSLFPGGGINLGKLSLPPPTSCSISSLFKVCTSSVEVKQCTSSAVTSMNYIHFSFISFIFGFIP